MRIFRQGRGPYALPLAVIGVKLGQRLLDVGADEARLFSELAGKVGLTGYACAVTGSGKGAERVKLAAARAGVLAEVEVARGSALPYPDGHFDVALLDDTAGFFAARDGSARKQIFVEVLRTLRAGGRAVLLEHQRTGLFGHLRGESRVRLHQGEGVSLLESAGFRPVRLLAEREGQRFSEGWKPAKAPEPVALESPPQATPSR
jgi:SAM-dependent methyltransferase